MIKLMTSKGKEYEASYAFTTSGESFQAKIHTTLKLSEIVSEFEDLKSIKVIRQDGKTEDNLIYLKPLRASKDNVNSEFVTLIFK